ncbi:unnamed protein product [Moneuplotes crassus]|uniref:Uncharacterized protein n=2 Tax=Euplotes crassus TaxID=5936 RepID=A0AAD1U2E2_EUPCR|nr:unnamed protein product [Moneuplotes crassus]
MFHSLKYGNLRKIQISTKRALSCIKGGHGSYFNSSGALRSNLSLNNYTVRQFQADKRATTTDEEKLDAKAKKEKELIKESMTSHKALQDKGKGKTSKKEIWNFIKPYLYADGNWKVFYLAMASMALSKGLALGAPYCLKIAVNALTTPNSYNLAFAGVMGFGLCRAFSSIFHELRMSLVVRIMREAIQKLSLQIFSHLHNLDLTFHKTSTKNTIFAMNKALSAIDDGLRFLIGFVSPIALEFSLICGMLYFYCGPLYLLNIGVMLGVYTKFTQSYSKIRQEYIRGRRNQDKKADFFLNESILSYDTVKYFGNENLEYNRYKKVQEEIYKVAMKVQYSLANLNSGQQTLFALGMTINLLLATKDIYAGVLTPGDFVMIQALFMQIAQPLHFMGTIFRNLDESQVNVEDLFLILKMQKAVKEKPDAKDYEYKKGDIEFKDVRYSYVKDETSDGKEVLETLFKDINFKLKGGKSNAIVGPSGFGKTTIFNMIYRIMDPSSGSILLDGQDLKDLKIKSFRDRISIVPQNGILFNDTIRFNLQYGNLEANQEDIERVCKQCNIHDRIMSMPDGYDSHVGDLGGKLSGGERQRILIARALLKDFDILLLDEATSSLDSRNEKNIIEELERELEGKTVIYCAHRLSSIMNCDNIIVMGEGEVQEEGTHYEMLSNPDSKYYQMWNDFLREKNQEEQAKEEDSDLEKN